MSWDDYVVSMIDSSCQDAAIVGTGPTPCVWACHPGGVLGKITPAEVKELTKEDRSSLFINGVTIGGVKCSVIRDSLNSPDSHMMDLRTKSTDGKPTCNVAIYRANTAIIIAMAAEGVYGGTLNTKTHLVGKYLRDQNV
ncbi:profilin-1-like [Mixophyes fleayi]|uniref:profilin-1-like n=1 Tax=Mixophyes fleayi TaxID=3061075 RepID=UPI003F4DF71E